MIVESRQRGRPHPHRWRTVAGQVERFCGCGEWKPHTGEFFINCVSHGRRKLSTTCRERHKLVTRQYQATTDRARRLAKGKAIRDLKRILAKQAADAKKRDEVALTVWTFPGVDNEAMSFLQRATAQWPTHDAGKGFYAR